MRTYSINDKYSSADIGIDITADSFAELLISAAEGLRDIMVSTAGGHECKNRLINVSAESKEQLLVDWLSELVYLFDSEGIVPQNYSVTVTQQDSAYHLRANVDYTIFEVKKDKGRHEVKAVTYYRLSIKETDGLLTCHVVLDL